MDARPEIEILDGQGLEAIAAEWGALWGRCPEASPFGAPEWLLPWARRYAPGRCGAAALRCGGSLEGLAPVFAWQGALMLAGTGPSDHGDWLLDAGAEPWADRLLAALSQVPCGPFDRIELRQLPAHSALLRTAPPPGWADSPGEGERADEPCLVAPLLAEDGVGAATKKCRSNWRYAMRRIGREGGTVERVPLPDVAHGMVELSRLHTLRWEARGEPGVLSDPLLDGFLQDAAAELAPAGLLRLYQVRFGAETAAVLLVLAGRAAHHYYLGGFDPRRAALGVSAALVGFAMAEAAREGATEFDLLRGGEAYKRRWGAVERPTFRRALRAA